MEQIFNLRKKRTVSETVSDVFNYLKIHFWNLFKGLLVFAGPFFLAGGIFMGMYYGNLFSAIETPNFMVPTMFLSFGVSMIFYAIGGVFFQAFIIEYMRLSLKHSKEELTLGVLWNAVKSKFFTYFGANFLFGILFVIAMIVPMLLSIVAAFLGPLVMFFAMIWGMIAFSLYPVALGIEEVGIFESYKRSFDLVKGNWWRSFGTYFLISIIQSFMSGIVIMPVYIALFYNAFSQSITHGTPPDVSSIGTIMNIIMPVFSFVSLMFYSISGVGFGMHYFSLVEEKEEVGLGEQIANLNQGLDA